MAECAILSWSGVQHSVTEIFKHPQASPIPPTQTIQASSAQLSNASPGYLFCDQLQLDLSAMPQIFIFPFRSGYYGSKKGFSVCHHRDQYPLLSASPSLFAIINTSTLLITRLRKTAVIVETSLSSQETLLSVSGELKHCAGFHWFLWRSWFNTGRLDPKKSRECWQSTARPRLAYLRSGSRKTGARGCLWSH